MTTTNSPIFVLASPRGGSSMLAGVMHHLGVDMGHIHDRLIKPDAHNPLGYFEDEDLVQETLFQINKNNFKKINFEKFGNLISAKQKKHLYGFKLTRLPLIMDYVEEYIPQNSKFVVIVRYPVSVHDSIKKYSNHSHESDIVYQRIAHQYYGILKFISSKDLDKFIFFDYDHFLLHKEEEIKRLANFLGVEGGGMVNKATEFVNKSLKHNKMTKEKKWKDVREVVNLKREKKETKEKPFMTVEDRLYWR